MSFNKNLTLKMISALSASENTLIMSLELAKQLSMQTTLITPHSLGDLTKSPNAFSFVYTSLGDDSEDTLTITFKKQSDSKNPLITVTGTHPSDYDNLDSCNVPMSPETIRATLAKTLPYIAVRF